MNPFWQAILARRMGPGGAGATRGSRAVKPKRTRSHQNTITREGTTRGTTHCEAAGRVPAVRSSTGIGHFAVSPAARDFFGPKFNDLSNQTSLSSHARGHGSLSGKNFLRPSIIALPASHTGASGARGQIIVGAALPLRRRGAVGSAPRCGTRACAVAIQSRVSFMARAMVAAQRTVGGTGWVLGFLQACS